LSPQNALKDQTNLSVEKLLFSLEETRQILGGISMGTLYNLRRRKKLTIVKVGSRSFITKECLEEFVAGLSEIESSKGTGEYDKAQED